MAEVTVSDFAKVLKVPVDRLLVSVAKSRHQDVITPKAVRNANPQTAFVTACALCG